VRSAFFFDRDGTLIDDAHYLNDASGVHLVAGAAVAVRRVNAAGVLAIVVTNQSGISRGRITEAQYRAVEARTVQLFAHGGARLDATYHCPHWPENDGACRCRKPALGMYDDAAREHHVTLAQSVYVGDRLRDAQPALTTGGLGILVAGVETPYDDLLRLQDEPRLRVADSLDDAVRLGLAWLAHANALPTRGGQS
jgi:histidinol-phosphate phosphatase family protein